jgi:hypothetical protein
LAVGEAYATNVQYKAIVTKTSGDNDSEIDAQLLAMSRVLERDCFGGRFFTKDAAPVARTYYPRVDNQRTLTVDDIASLTGLVVKVDDNRDGVAEVTLVNPPAANSDFELEPRNAALGPEPQPWTQLYLPPRAKRSYWWELIEVTAVFGWPAVPQAIVQATCQLVGILRLDSPRATQQISEGLGAVIGTSRVAQTIVDKLIDAYAKPAWIYA